MLVLLASGLDVQLKETTCIKMQGRPGGLAQWVKCLLGKHHIPRIHIRSKQAS